MPSATTSPTRTNGRTCFTGRARPTAGACISRPRRGRRGRAAAARGAAGAAAGVPARPARRSTSSAAISTTVHQRVAKKFRVGRAILAGDAAHVNSPIGAMGMNSGVHDAFNLADKLDRDPAPGGRRRGARPLRAPAPARRAPAHAGAKPSATSALLAEKDPAVRRKNHDAVAPHRRGPETCARVSAAQSSLIESLREAEQIA